MDRREFTEYMNRLEELVIVRSLTKGRLGRTVWLPILNGNLHS